MKNSKEKVKQFWESLPDNGDEAYQFLVDLFESKELNHLEKGERLGKLIAAAMMYRTIVQTGEEVANDERANELLKNISTKVMFEA